MGAFGLFFDPGGRPRGFLAVVVIDVGAGTVVRGRGIVEIMSMERSVMAVGV